MYVIMDQIKELSQGSGKTASFADQIIHSGSAGVFGEAGSVGDAKPSKHSPDGSFIHETAIYPGVIIEVSYPQKRKDLGRLADEYLMDSRGNIRVVVGLDIEYKGCMATLSVWRTRVEGKRARPFQEIQDVVFRDDQGQPTTNDGLKLMLSEFTNKDLAMSELGHEDKEITVSAAQLCHALDKAERQVRRAVNRDLSNSDIEFPRRSHTPPEILAPEDEAKFAEQEDNVSQSGADQDADFVGSSPSDNEERPRKRTRSSYN
jgi:hypothetical protein